MGIGRSMLSVRDLERLAFCSPARGAGKVVLLVEAIFASPDGQTSWPAIDTALACTARGVTRNARDGPGLIAAAHERYSRARLRSAGVSAPWPRGDVSTRRSSGHPSWKPHAT